ncbi:MAG: hypothetical protein EOO61_13250 [Hymenobacter sp.]|nr:MAG: hypothetical protein EOO61_13250 [Hymenobacter sp.]
MTSKSGLACHALEWLQCSFLHDRLGDGAMTLILRLSTSWTPAELEYEAARSWEVRCCVM